MTRETKNSIENHHRRYESLLIASRPLVNKEHINILEIISLVILLFVGTNIETDLNSSLSVVQELRHCFDGIEFLSKFKCYGLELLMLCGRSYDDSYLRNTADE